MIGVKIKDGLFLGDGDDAQDLQCAYACKISRVVNCCRGKEPNHLETEGIKYLTYDFENPGNPTVLGKDDAVINEFFNFIEPALALEEGVLVHYHQDQSRASCLITAWLMKKYRWSFNKASEFMKCRSLEAAATVGLRLQLIGYENRLAAESETRPLEQGWEEAELDGNSEELLLRNTFLNLQAKASEQPSQTKKVSAESSQRIRWADAAGKGLTEEQEPEEPLSPLSMLCQQPVKRAPVMQVKFTGPLRSILRNSSKGSGQDTVPEAGRPDDPRTLTIQTRSRVLHCDPKEIVRKRLGLKSGRSFIVLEYEVPSQRLLAHHKMKVSLDMVCTDGDRDMAIVESLRQENRPWLDGVSTEQLSKLVKRLQSSRCAAGGC
mmetsp:Transcript_33007/g.58620  ORF Transcript_33007/g.58620 Transcript_33007/m.58620 type:complete len:378 (+) Transcript_33007:54-1187(+)